MFEYCVFFTRQQNVKVFHKSLPTPRPSAEPSANPSRRVTRRRCPHPARGRCAHPYRARSATTPNAPPVPAPAPSHVSGASPAPLPLRRDATRRIYGAPLVTKITTSGGGRLPPCGKLGRLARGCFASPLGGPGRAATSDSRGRCSWGYRAAVGLRPARRLPSGFLGLCATVVFFAFGGRAASSARRSQSARAFVPRGALSGRDVGGGTSVLRSDWLLPELSLGSSFAPDRGTGGGREEGSVRGKRGAFVGRWLRRHAGTLPADGLPTATRRRLGACVSGGRARLGSALRRRGGVGLGRLPPPAAWSPALCVRGVQGAAARGLEAPTGVL